MATVIRTSVAHQNCLLLNGMTSLAVGGARVDGVFVVEAPARGVAFDDLVAHFEGI
jgi:hypothetical protein